ANFYCANWREYRAWYDSQSIFFFSSRRGHTRFSRDWSSDVSSSDLFFSALRSSFCRTASSTSSTRRKSSATRSRTCRATSTSTRSEERRVGKEGRNGRAGVHRIRKRGLSERDDTVEGIGTGH